MDNIATLLNTALERYFNTLSVFGYKSYNEVNKLLVLAWIEEMLSSELSNFVTEEDYRSITNAIYCLMGSTCLIDIPSYATWDSLYHNNPNYIYSIRYRISEDNILRNSEDDLLRTAVESTTSSQELEYTTDYIETKIVKAL